MFGTEPFIFCMLLLALSMLARFPCDDQLDGDEGLDDLIEGNLVDPKHSL